jgi:demethylmenaquinone methyltransferase/2-methoxy-6-polyprenyl-1,4-benzoquinol methylase/phosphoethanolamine N-methyltransferase
MSHFHSHSGSSEHTPTAGVVIHWATLYAFLFNRILRPSEPGILSLAQLKAGDAVLDVGCGSGQLTLAAQGRVGAGGQAYGIDPSPEMIAVSQRNAARAGSPARFQVGVVESIPYPESTFDVVMSRLVMHHLPGDLKQRGLAEMRRVLRPGGICLVVDFEPPKTPFMRMVVENHLSPLMAKVDVREYQPLFIEAGFTEIKNGPTSSRYLSFVSGRSPV